MNTVDALVHLTGTLSLRQQRELLIRIIDQHHHIIQALPDDYDHHHASLDALGVVKLGTRIFVHESQQRTARLTTFPGRDDV